MSALRQREHSGDKLNPNDKVIGKSNRVADGTTRKLDRAQGSANKTVQILPWSYSLPGLVLVAFASLTISMFFMLYPSVPGLRTPSYAVCSPNGQHIYTVDKSNTRMQCLVVHGSHIVDTGPLEDIQHRWNSYSLVVQGLDALKGVPRKPLSIHYLQPGSIVVPGLSDSHAHILEYGASQAMPLESANSIPDAVAVVKNYILANLDIYGDTSRFIEGWGWDHTSWPFEQWPTAADLDSDPVVQGRPVVLQSKDGHALWVSSKVLEYSHPLPGSIEGGIIMRDTSGNPTGVVLDNAQDLMARMPLTDDVLSKRFATTVKAAVSLGLTSIHDAGLNPVSLKFFKSQAKQGNLPIRIYGMVYFDENGEYWGNTTSPIVDDGNNRLSVGGVKLFADGALRSGGAALYEPYADNPDTNGFMRISSEVLNTIIPQFLQDGWQVNVHAIGDRANGIVLDAFEAALEDINVTALRPRLEHAQIMTKADMARVGELGVIASVQPTHVISDMWYAEDRLGSERVKGLYAFRSLLDSGARITLGSDSPVEDLNPLSGFYAAITRVSADGTSPHGPRGWFPDQCLTREEALRGMTIDSAYASFSEMSLGSIEPGKRADYTVLSQDIMSIPASLILDTKVLLTVIDGKPVFGHF